jgi:hypothetical protein
MECKICGGHREPTGNLIDISKYTGRYIHKVAEYICLQCGAKSTIDGTDMSHFNKDKRLA